MSGRPLGVRFSAVGVVGLYSGRYKGVPLPTIFIHPVKSPNSTSIGQDADGTKALQIFRTRNGCGESRTPASVAGCASNAAVNPGCVDFDGCSAPLRWCQHDDPIGLTTGDPWPCFAGAAILEFFAR